MEKLLGFGCMRLPMKDNNVDYEEFNKMIDYYMENGFNYFDTAHGYINGKSEIAIRECLVKRYDRSKYILTNKLISAILYILCLTLSLDKIISFSFGDNLLNSVNILL